MNLDLWKRDFLHVWRASRRMAIVHSLLILVPVSLLVGLCVLVPLLSLILVPLLVVGSTAWWVQLHLAGYEAARDSSVRVGLFDRTEALRENWKSLALGYALWMALYMVGSIFVLPAFAVLALLMPYFLFIAVEGKGPIEALEANVRLAGDRIGEVMVFWLLMTVGMLGLAMPLIGVILGGLFMGGNAEGSTLLWVVVALTIPLMVGYSAVAYSIQVAAGVTSYRVLRGQTVDAIDENAFAMSGAVAALREVDLVMW